MKWYHSLILGLLSVSIMRSYEVGAFGGAMWAVIALGWCGMTIALMFNLLKDRK